MNDAQTAIRNMTLDDLAAVLPLMEQLGYDVGGDELARRFRTVSGAGGHCLLVAECEGRIAGFCHVFVRPALEKPPEAIVQSMVVDKAARRGGVGRALMATAEAWAREAGFVSVALSSQIERDDAHAFYANLGYARVATSGLLRKQLGP